MTTRAVFSSDGQQGGLGITTTVVPPVLSVPSQGQQPLEAGAPVFDVSILLEGIGNDRIPVRVRIF